MATPPPSIFGDTCAALQMAPDVSHRTHSLAQDTLLPGSEPHYNNAPNTLFAIHRSFTPIKPFLLSFIYPTFLLFTLFPSPTIFKHLQNCSPILNVNKEITKQPSSCFPLFTTLAIVSAFVVFRCTTRWNQNKQLYWLNDLWNANK